MRIAIVLSTFHEDIAERLLKGAWKVLRSRSISENNVEIVRVPGAFEIPIVCQKLIDRAQKKGLKWDGIVSLGAVIKGETDHYEAVCQGVTYGLQKVAIENRTPIMFGILMCRDIKQARNRSQESRDKNKGCECVSALFSLLQGS